MVRLWIKFLAWLDSREDRKMARQKIRRAAVYMLSNGGTKMCVSRDSFPNEAIWQYAIGYAKKIGYVIDAEPTDSCVYFRIC